MLFTEWNLEDAKEVWQAEAREEAEEKAKVKAIAEERKYTLELLNQGLSVDEIRQRLLNDVAEAQEQLAVKPQAVFS